MTTRTRELLQVESTDRYSRVIMLIVESGALIAVAKIVEFTLFKMAPVDGLHGLNALYVVYEIMPQVTVSVPGPRTLPRLHADENDRVSRRR